MKRINRLKPYRDDEKKDGTYEEENVYSYQAKGGSRVFIPQIINPFAVLHVSKAASISECKVAFRQHIATPNRQQRVLVAYAAHMLSNSVLYTKGERTLCDVFDYAISGDTDGLTRELQRYPAALECSDTSCRSLLYVAARSGFYDTCEFLLKKGARPIACGEDHSTPLHVASYYGHSLVCMLLVCHGALVNERNEYGNTPIDEARDSDVRQQLIDNVGNRIMALIQSVKSFITIPIENVTHNGNHVAKVFRQRHNRVPTGWLPAWHGTKFRYVRSILKNGLQPAGSNVNGKMIRPPKGHYKLGSTHFGITNWANATFISPSLLYAGHPTYAERVVVNEKQWCVVICVACRPVSFSSHPSTITSDDPVDGEPTVPEWRIDVEGDDLIWRVVGLLENPVGNVMVTGVAFIDLDFFDNIGQARGVPYRRATNLIHPDLS